MKKKGLPTYIESLFWLQFFCPNYEFKSCSSYCTILVWVCTVISYDNLCRCVFLSAPTWVLSYFKIQTSDVIWDGLCAWLLMVVKWLFIDIIMWSVCLWDDIMCFAKKTLRFKCDLHCSFEHHSACINNVVLYSSLEILWVCETWLRNV